MADKLWEVVMEGDEVEWQARPGVNLNRQGVPRPWKAPAQGRIQLRAPSKDEAVFVARLRNPEYHTVKSVRELKG